MAAISKIRTCLTDYVDGRWHYNWTTDRCCGYDRLLFFCNRQTTRSPNIRINIKLYLNVQRVWLWNHSARSCSPGVIHHIAQAQLAIGLYSYSQLCTPGIFRCVYCQQIYRRDLVYHWVTSYKLYRYPKLFLKFHCYLYMIYQCRVHQ